MRVFWLGRMPGGGIWRLKPDKMDALNDCGVADDIVTDIIDANNENQRLQTVWQEISAPAKIREKKANTNTKTKT